MNVIRILLIVSLCFAMLIPAYAQYPDSRIEVDEGVIYHDNDLFIITNSDDIRFQTSLNGINKDRLRIKEDGKTEIYNEGQVGLQIQGSNPFWTSIYINSLVTGANPNYGYLREGYLRGNHYLDNDNNWLLKLSPSIGGATENRFFVGSDGKIGINTFSPQRDLDVTNYIRVSQEPGNNDGCYLEMFQEGTGVVYQDFRLDNSGSLLYLSSSDDDFSNFYDIASFGNNSSTYALRLFGDAAKPGGGSWAVASDKRIKKDIHSYTDGLSQILKIKPVKFRYNEARGYNTNKEYIGVIAQELQEVAPYMVKEIANPQRDQLSKTSGSEYLSVDPSALDFMLINAVKELAAENKSLKENNEKLNFKFEQLEKLVQSMMK